MLGVVRKLFIVKEELLAGGENKRRPAINTLQLSVCKCHGRFLEAGVKEEFGP